MQFSELADDFRRLTADIVYCTVTTVDDRNRPRSRVMHPIFEVADGEPRGWAVTDRTPVKAGHLAANPHVACFYWSPAQNTVSIDCVASWATGDLELQHAWDLFAGPPPLGWGDMSGYGAEGIRHPTFHVLRLQPWRIQILLADQFAAGDFTPRIWRSSR
jgi:general stress protein 26